MELQGKVVLVTGGGGGLGEAICRTLGAAGCVIVAADLRREPAVAVAQSLRETGVRASALALDVSDETAAAETVQRILTEEGRLDVLVNNAGTDVTLPVEE